MGIIGRGHISFFFCCGFSYFATILSNDFGLIPNPTLKKSVEESRNYSP